MEERTYSCDRCGEILSFGVDPDDVIQLCRRCEKVIEYDKRNLT